MTVAARVLEIYCNVENTLPSPVLLNYQRNGLNENQKVYFVKEEHSEQSFWITIKTIYRIDGVDSLKWHRVVFIRYSRGKKLKKNVYMDPH